MKGDPENNIVIKEIGFSLLAEGTTLRVKAEGYSMYPSIKPGSSLLIKPASDQSLLSPGEIIAWKRKSGLVVHRLIRIVKEDNRVFYITRGDSCAYEDPPVIPDRIAGKVIQVETPSGTIISAGDKLIRKPFYLYNRVIVWVMVRIGKVLNGPQHPQGG